MRWIFPWMMVCAILSWGGSWSCQDYGSLELPGDGWVEDTDRDGGADAGTEVGDDGSTSPDCPTFIGALADCPFTYRTPLEPGACPAVVCREQPCIANVDCPPGEGADHGTRCVQGNCVYCVHDGHCPGGRICRTGRCVEPIVGCPPLPCSQEDCRLVSPSELPCPVCVCRLSFDRACQSDQDCEYGRCIFGRCAGCLTDQDCDFFGRCQVPGICMSPDVHSSLLYGTWLIGWSGGMEHRSYFRFEPDGTLRRGSYSEDGLFTDDIPTFPCMPAGGIPKPAVGTWEVETTQTYNFYVTLNLNVSCDPGAGFVARYVDVVFAADGRSATFEDLSSALQYDGWKVPAETCAPDMSTCQPPSFLGKEAPAP